MYGGLSRSTRNISLEMNTEEGRALFRRLVAVADVVIENFGAETMPHWDCSFDDLLAVNPRLVMVSLSGYGRTGPRSSYLAYATNISNFSGLTSTWQYQHGTHSDYIAAIHAAIGTLAAIAQSDQTDSGVYIDVAQTEALAAVMAPIYLDPLNNGRDTPPTGNAVPGSLFTGAFACQGHDRWLAIELEDVSDWSTLCQAIERPDLAIGDATEADARRGDLTDAVSTWTAERSPHTAAQVLQNVGLAAGTVYDNEDAVRDPQLRARGASVEIDHPDLGVIEYYQSAHRMTKTPGFVRRRGPRLGEHTCEVLQEWLSLDAHEISVLEAADAVWQAPADAPSTTRRRADRSGGRRAVRYPIGIVAVAFGGGPASTMPRSAPPTWASTTSTRRPRPSTGSTPRSSPIWRCRSAIASPGSRWSRAARRWHPSSVAAKTASTRPSSCSAATPVPGSSPGPAARRRATPKSRRWSPRCPACASPSTPATWRPGAAIPFRCCATPTTCSCARPRRAARSSTPTRVVTSTSPPCSPSSIGSTTPA